MVCVKEDATNKLIQKYLYQFTFILNTNEEIKWLFSSIRFIGLFSYLFVLNFQLYNLILMQPLQISRWLDAQLHCVQTSSIQFSRCEASILIKVVYFIRGSDSKLNIFQISPVMQTVTVHLQTNPPPPYFSKQYCLHIIYFLLQVQFRMSSSIDVAVRVL